MDVTKGAKAVQPAFAKENLRAGKRFGLVPVPANPRVIPGWNPRIAKWAAA